MVFEIYKLVILFCFRYCDMSKLYWTITEDKSKTLLYIYMISHFPVVSSTWVHPIFCWWIRGAHLFCILYLLLCLVTFVFVLCPMFLVFLDCPFLTIVSFILRVISYHAYLYAVLSTSYQYLFCYNSVLSDYTLSCCKFKSDSPLKGLINYEINMR